MEGVQIKIHKDNGKPFITALYNILLVPNLCDLLISIITLMRLGHTLLFHKVFCTVFFSDNENNVATLSQTTQIKQTFLVKMKEKSESNKKIPKKKVTLELLNQRLGHRSTR